MAFRILSLRTIGIFAIGATIAYVIFAQRLFVSKSVYNLNTILASSSSSSSSIGTSSLKILESNIVESLPTILVDSFIYGEFTSMNSRPIRISPSELDKPLEKREYTTEVLSYNEERFRQSSTPILWLDEKLDVRWNHAAERGMINYLTKKQFPNLNTIGKSTFNKQEILDTCHPQSLFILHQHWSGFFSRVLCFIAIFGQTLYTPRIGVLRGSRFSINRGDTDDFLGQGVTRFFLPISICSAYQYHPEMQSLKNLIDASPNPIHVLTIKDIYKNAINQENRVLLSTEYWKPDYHHVPIRKWLFDRKQSSVSYNSSIEILSDHSDEHIYAPKNEQNVSIGEWIDRNKPDAFSSDMLPNDGKYKLTWKDYVFGSFLRYMFVLFFGSQNTPRIEYGVRILTRHWLNYLIDKYSLIERTNIFSKLAGLYIRRGDKSPEDSFWRRHNHWRNLSLYVKGIIDEEKRRNTTYQYIFVMTDDASVISTLQAYTNPKSTGTDEVYARKHLRGREILYNVLAPQACFDPFHRIGFDQFLVSMRFLIEYSAITVGHIDSNVFRFLREVVYAQRQHNPAVQTLTYTQDAPDSLLENT